MMKGKSASSMVCSMVMESGIKTLACMRLWMNGSGGSLSPSFPSEYKSPFLNPLTLPSPEGRGRKDNASHGGRGDLKEAIYDRGQYICFPRTCEVVRPPRYSNILNRRAPPEPRICGACGRRVEGR
jgi:hypothetical protein